MQIPHRRQKTNREAPATRKIKPVLNCPSNPIPSKLGSNMKSISLIFYIFVLYEAHGLKSLGKTFKNEDEMYQTDHKILRMDNII